MAITHHLFETIYGEILGPLAETLAKAKAAGEEVDLKISSVGGEVTVGWAAYQLIKDSGVRVTADVIGICASAATYILLACPVRKMSANATLMIHEAEAWAGGRAEELALTAEQVQRVNDQMVELYSKATKLTAEEARAAMKATTYYSAQEAKEKGFVSEVYASVDAANRTLIAASMKRSAPMREAALAVAKDTMTVEELITACKALSAEDQDKLKAAVAPTSEPVVTTDESNLGEAIVKLTGVEASAAIGVVMAWKTSAESERVPAVDPIKALDDLFAKYPKKVTPALKASIKSQIDAGTLGLPGAKAWLEHSPDVHVTEPVRASLKTAPNSGTSAATYEGMTYTELLAKAPAKLAALRRENPELYESLRTSAG